MKLANLASLPNADETVAVASRFARLSVLGPVGLDAASCLARHKSWVACRACQAACPRDCLTVDGATIALAADACVGCGRCAAACPTGALAVDGFRFPDLASGQVLSLACHRQQAAPSDAIRVPCLGGLTAGDLLALLWRTGGAPLRLVDDGSCRSCVSNASTGAPPQQLAADVAPLLRAARLAADRVVVAAPGPRLPNGNGASPMATPVASMAPAAAERPAAARRAFFSGLGRAVSAGIVRQAGAASPLADPDRQPRQPRQRLPNIRGQAIRLLLQHFASQAGQSPAAARLVQLTASDRCRGHGACTRLCPTGALHAEMLEGRRLLAFDAWQCIACGSCASACPEGALRYEGPAWRAFAVGNVVLSRAEQVACRRCGDLFVTVDRGELCAVCARAEGLAQAGVALFAGFRQGNRNDIKETGPPGERAGG